MSKTAITTPDFPKPVQTDPSFVVTMLPCYDKDRLASVSVSQIFIDYLSTMGLVQKQET
jgi:hypothetical protein